VSVSIALFTRDLRIHDNPVLDAAVRNTERVVPFFVRDPAIADSVGRAAFLAECLADLDDSLRRLGGHLVVRPGDVVAAVCRLAREVGAERVHVAAEYSAYGRLRERRLRDALAAERRSLCRHDEVHGVIAPGRLTPDGKDHFAVFTPYWRRWSEAPRRALVAPPKRLLVPPVEGMSVRGPRTVPMAGGERAARRRAESWLRERIRDYEVARDLLGADGTSRLSAYLHFGCVSARELVARSGRSAGAKAFVRQLAWRDFYLQVLAARPHAAREDYRARGGDWRDASEAVAAWREGQTGFPVVDAAMRQLLAEGWMHNRGRLIVGSFLTKTLGVDWRVGAAHFEKHLLDADLANNRLNWQWVAGTGTDTRPNRILNPVRQGERYDPDGAYTRRWAPELSGLTDRYLHQPWRLKDSERRRLDYPDPIVNLDDARTRLLASRS
jgi:deoxyribodipyrimidine photo-lyase